MVLKNKIHFAVGFFFFFGYFIFKIIGYAHFCQISFILFLMPYDMAIITKSPHQSFIQNWCEHMEIMDVFEGC